MTKPGTESLRGLDPRSGAHLALAAALAAASVDDAPLGPHSRAELESQLGHPVDVIAIRCSGHAVNGKVKTPRVAYAARIDDERGWHFGGTLSAALELDAAAARSPWANRVRTDAHLAKQDGGDERSVVACSGCPDRFVFSDGPRIAAVLKALLDEGTHTVSIAELRKRY